MTPKKGVIIGPFGRKHLLSMRWRVGIVLSAVLFILVITKSNFEFSNNPSLSSSSSRKIDAGGIHNRRLKNDSPKVAFLFLVKRDLPLDFLWANFFENAGVGNFSIYIHSTPGFEFNESTTRSPLFYNRHIKNSVKVAWGESSMIEAERLLLSAAFEDPFNEKFVLLSDSCVPLYNFSYLYDYLLASPNSFVDSFLDVKETRYNQKMSPAIPKKKWRKGSQWITLNRRHTEAIINDDIIFPIFQKHCKRRPTKHANPKLQKQHNCIPDEHYVQTLLSMKEVEGEIERRTLTYTEWDPSDTKTDDHGWHPKTFTYTNTNDEKITSIKNIDHLNFETEKRIELCKINEVRVPCFLFARKFSRGAAMRLLAQPALPFFDSPELLSSAS